MYCNTAKTLDRFINIDQKLMQNLARIVGEFAERHHQGNRLPESVVFSVKDQKEVNYRLESTAVFVEFVENKNIVFEEVSIGYGGFSGALVSISIQKNSKGKFQISYSIASNESDLFYTQKEIEETIRANEESSLGYLIFKKEMVPILAGVVLAFFSLYEPKTFLQGIIEDPAGEGVSAVISMAFIGFVIYWILSIFNDRLGQFLYPEKVINLGIGKAIWQRAKSLRVNLFWVILVGTLIGVLAPLVIW